MRSFLSMRAVSLRDRFRFAQTHVRVRAVDNAAHALARVRFSLPDANPARFHVAVQENLRYREGNDPAHHLDVYIPTRSPKPLPIVMYVHGGGFAMLSKQTHRLMALLYARRGYLTFVIDYRLGPKHTYPAPLEDATDALIWVKNNAERFGGDLSRLAIAGESAGGNLVTALTVESCLKRPEPFARRLYDANVPLRAVVATYGFLDLEGSHRFESHPKLSRQLKDMVRHAAASYVGIDVEAGCAAAPLASPLRLLESAEKTDRPLPPIFADAGTKDPLLDNSRRLKSAVERLGGSCDLHIAPGEIHGYDAMVWRSASREKWKKAHEFLKANLAPA